MSEKEQKRRFFFTVGITWVFLMCFAAITVYIDPYLHYGGEKEGLSYRFREERYTNPGMIKNLDYDTIIVGTSMTKNFKTTSLDKALQCKSIKTPIPGGRFADVNVLLSLAYDNDKNVKNAFVSLDVDRIIDDANYRNDDTVPYYLYDNNYLNDTGYLLNKSILIHDCAVVALRSFRKSEKMSMDEYSSFEFETGIEEIIKNSSFSSYSLPMKEYSVEDRKLVEDNIDINFGELIKSHPETQFIFFVPPYSIEFWNEANREGEVLRYLGAKKQAVSQLLEYDNVKVYDFLSEQDIICNWDYYNDTVHYNSYISDLIIQKIANGENELVKGNVSAMYDREYKFFTSYKYRE